MLKRIFLLLACFTLFFVPNVKADSWNKKTVITTNQSVEIPGVVLPAGKYVIKLVDLQARNLVTVMNADENKVYATFFGTADYILTPHDKVYIGLEERRADLPMAIHEWFYPGDASGLEFTYPKLAGR